MVKAASILGLARLDRKLKRMPAVAKDTIRQAMEQGANEIVGMMKSLAPVDDGDLRDSIGWTWGKLPKGKRAIGGVTVSPVADLVASLGGDLTITIYAGGGDAYYARFVEFGTKASIAQGPAPDRRHKSGEVMTKGKGGHAATKAQPFFYVSWRANQKKVKSNVRRAITRAAKQVAANGSSS